MKNKPRHAKGLIVPALLIAVTLLTMSGACSQHEPGPYEGSGGSGGRTYPTAVIGAAGGNTGDQDSSFPDDVFELPDISIPKDVSIGQ